MEMPRDHCVRCGQCCTGSTPGLHKEDVALVREGRLQKRALFTIRTGELVRDNIRGEVRVTEEEIIKVKGHGESEACMHYDEASKACRIYSHRPIQCRALSCWDAHEFMHAYQTPKATRRDIVTDRILLNLMERHEEKCGYRELEDSVKAIEGEGERAVGRILEMLRFDYALRPFISERLGINPDEMDFLFGRPLLKTIGRYGLQVRRETDGSFFLTALNGR